MNSQIARMQTLVTDLDSFTQLAVFGSWQFAVNNACINAAMRYVPDEPTDNGIEHYTEYEAARRALIRDADGSRLPALIGLQREIGGWIEEADGTSRGLDDTLAWLTGNAPKREQFERDYEERRAAGLKPGMSKRTFVEYELERAVAQYNRLVGRGEDAVRLCDTVTVTGDAGHELPDWLVEAFQQKLVDKLLARWEKLELTRTNPRRRRQIRDAAAADQLLIRRVLAEFGEEPELDDSDDEGDAPTTDALDDTLDDVLPRAA